MSLPVGKLGTDTVEIDGTVIEIHSLGAAKGFGMYDYQDGRRAELPAYIIEHGTDSTPEDVARFMDTHQLEDAVKLMNAILELSGLSETFRARVSDGG